MLLWSQSARLKLQAENDHRLYLESIVATMTTVNNKDTVITTPPMVTTEQLSSSSSSSFTPLSTSSVVITGNTTPGIANAIDTTDGTITNAAATTTAVKTGTMDTVNNTNNRHLGHTSASDEYNRNIEAEKERIYGATLGEQRAHIMTRILHNYDTIIY